MRFIRTSGFIARYPPAMTITRTNIPSRMRSFELGGIGPFFPGGPRTTVLSMSDWFGSAAGAGAGSFAKKMLHPKSAWIETAGLDATLIRPSLATEPTLGV
jgi:hypothetical protein